MGDEKYPNQVQSYQIFSNKVLFRAAIITAIVRYIRKLWKYNTYMRCASPIVN
jgi:hypothetical protein